jgi:hypothetical protein
MFLFVAGSPILSNCKQTKFSVTNINIPYTTSFAKIIRVAFIPDKCFASKTM